MAKLLVGIDDADDIGMLIKSGADEFYCGLRGKYGILNLKSSQPAANLSGFDKLESVVKESHKHGIPVFLARNSRFLELEQIDAVLEETSIAVEVGIDGVIAANLALLSELNKRKFPIKVISSCFLPAINEETIRFYQAVGIDRIVLPRQLPIKEIKNLVDCFPGYEFEVFIFYAGCSLLDGFCRFDVEHPAVMTSYFHIGDFPVAHHEKLECRLESCGACALYHFYQYGNLSLKIASRSLELKKKNSTVRMLAGLLNWLETEDVPQGAFTKKVRWDFQDFFNRPCTPRMCYYP
jgi:putative protease